MLNRIQKALSACGISEWRVADRTESTTELFFVRKQLDTRRIKDTRKFFVTVFRKEEKGGKQLRGETSVTLLESMDDARIEQELRDAYYAAQFALNPDYALPDAVQAPEIRKTGFLAEKPMQETADIMTKALFAADCRADSFLNSAEIFVSKTVSRVVSSYGTDVSWTDATVKGEYVVQCKEPEDVELYYEFEYGECEPEALTKEVAESLSFASDRARAQKILKTGEYDLLLSADSVPEVLSYYLTRANAEMVFPGYSDWKPGQDVQEVSDGEPVDLTLLPKAPYNDEGLPMCPIRLLENGKLNGYYGSTRFCRYLGIEPTGNFRRFACENAGTESFGDMKKKPCLWAVSFSDFQMDSFSGHFGGEIRLAYLLEDGKAIPVTGGSVNGNLLEAQKHLRFSTDRYVCAGYEGPYAVRIPSVAVAGSDSDE